MHIYNNKYDIKKFINRTSNDKIFPLKINKLITDIKNNPIYNSIYNFYGELDEDKFKKYYIEFEKYIKKQYQKEKMNRIDLLINGFKNITKDNFKNLFINNFYEDFNTLIFKDANDINIEECIAYFTARIIYCFTDYTNNKNKNYNWDKKRIYMGTHLKLSELLQYERKKGKLAFSQFTIFYEKKELAEKLSNREKSKQYYDENLEFSVIFILRKKEINNGIIIEDFCKNKEKAILFLPYSLFELKKIEFDFINKTADIYI